MTYILNEAQEAWLKALESGRYKQTRARLYDGKGYCCLGVACDLAGIKFTLEDGLYYAEDEAGGAPPVIEKSLRLRGCTGEVLHSDRLIVNGQPYTSLAQANDFGESFADIAKAIRSNPTAVFKE